MGKKIIAKKNKAVVFKGLIALMVVIFLSEALFLILHELKSYSPPAFVRSCYPPDGFGVAAASVSGAYIYLINPAGDRCVIMDKQTCKIAGNIIFKGCVACSAYGEGDMAFLFDSPSRIDIYSGGNKLREIQLNTIKRPDRVKTDKAGNFYVSDMGRASLIKTDSAGKELFAVKMADNPDRSRWGGSVTLNKEGNIYMLENDKIISVFDGNGVLKRKWKAFQMFDWNGPDDIMIADDGLLYLLDREGHRIFVYNTGGKCLGRFSGGSNHPGKFVYPGYMASDDKCIYVGLPGCFVAYSFFIDR
jgi:hypothetical protein